MPRPIKAGLFEGSFVWVEVSFVLRGTNAILMQLLNKLFEVSY